jgi:predicted dehydrogenase
MAIIGLGGRGNVYAQFIKNNPDLYELVSITDTNPTKHQYAQTEYNLRPEQCFGSIEEFMKSEKMADIVAICTQDRDHRYHSVLCMDKGYDLLLEKPISNILEDCLYLEEYAVKKNVKVIICHVLRYTSFYTAIKNMIEKGQLGEIISIQASENVGYWHQAHSFVRGPWHKESDSSPMILAKCCHDLDIISWLIGKKCTTVSSFGSLKHFNIANAPANSGERCASCKIAQECVYNAKNIYMDRMWWAGHFVDGEITEASLVEGLATSDYGRCVYRMDNDVVDHQVVNINFEGDTTAQLTMTAFSAHIYRDIKIWGTKAELSGHMEDKWINITPFGKEPEMLKLDEFETDFSNHGGGDNNLMRDLHKFYNGEKIEKLSLISESVESHKMAFAAETSRVQNGIPVNI